MTVTVQNAACFAIGDTLTQAQERFAKTFPGHEWDFIIIGKEGHRPLFHARGECIDMEMEELKVYPSLFSVVSQVMV